MDKMTYSDTSRIAQKKAKMELVHNETKKIYSIRPSGNQEGSKNTTTWIIPKETGARAVSSQICKYSSPIV